MGICSLEPLLTRLWEMMGRHDENRDKCEKRVDGSPREVGTYLGRLETSMAFPSMDPSMLSLEHIIFRARTMTRAGTSLHPESVSIAKATKYKVQSIRYLFVFSTRVHSDRSHSLIHYYTSV